MVKNRERDTESRRDRDMASEEEATFSDARRGAGGKLKRQSARKHPATPYSRPTQNLVQRSRWISRVVDPAYRIIAGGATRILPYFFSKAASAAALTAPDAYNQLQDELQNNPEENDSSIPPSLNTLESAPIEEGGSNSRGKVDESNSIIRSQPRALNGVTGMILELERLMEGKTFSQAETDRLIEIINSRAIDLPGVKMDEKTLERPSMEGAKKYMSFGDTGEGPSSGNDTYSELWATPTPLAKSIIQDQAGVSPVELAKAYMGGKASSGSQGHVAKKERDCLDRDMLIAKSSAATLSSKPSACWPGVKLSEQCGFTTPQSQRERLGRLNLPRTPYSRTILSNSKSKLMQLQDDSSKHVDILQSPSQSLQTRHGQFKFSKGSDDGLFGPNRRSRKSTMMSPYSRPFGRTSHLENSSTTKSSEAWQPSTLSTPHKTDGKPKGLEVGTPTVPKHSSQVARMILDHLERSQPTPKDKSAELKLATSWRNPQSSNAVRQQSSLSIHNEKKDGSAKLNEDTQKFSSHNQPSSAPKSSPVTTGVLVDAVNKTSSASNGIFFGSHESSSSGTTPQYELQKPKDPLAENTHEKVVSSSHDTAKAVSFSFGGAPANLPKPSSPGSNKRTLPSISVAKPIQRWTVPSDSSITFTFPVSSAGAASSEPTTPSIMPTTSTTLSGVAITNHQKGKDDEIPNFSFNSESGSSSPLVFAFPSVSEELSHGDDARLGIKFNFGSEKPERLSFSLTGYDGVCC